MKAPARTCAAPCANASGRYRARRSTSATSAERLRLLIGPRDRRDGGAGPALAGHLELADLQRADLDLLGAQSPDHRVSDREPADGQRADGGDGESKRPHRRRPEDAGADSHRAGHARRRGGGAGPLATDADHAGHGASCGGASDLASHRRASGHAYATTGGRQAVGRRSPAWSSTPELLSSVPANKWPPLGHWGGRTILHRLE